MKSIVYGMLIVLFIMSVNMMGCAGFDVCTKMSTVQVASVQTTLESIQRYYPALQALVASIPVAGPTLALAIPAVMSLADTSLKNLGTMLETKCVDNGTLSLAQVAVGVIEGFFQSAETQQAMHRLKIQRPN